MHKQSEVERKNKEISLLLWFWAGKCSPCLNEWSTSLLQPNAASVSHEAPLSGSLITQVQSEVKQLPVGISRKKQKCQGASESWECGPVACGNMQRKELQTLITHIRHKQCFGFIMHCPLWMALPEYLVFWPSRPQSLAVISSLPSLAPPLQTLYSHHRS